MRFLVLLRALERATRPTDPETAAALDLRWAELPEQVRTDAQLLRRRFTGCEGTHGVFPRCDLACTPCYHSREERLAARSSAMAHPDEDRLVPACVQHAVLDPLERAP